MSTIEPQRAQAQEPTIVFLHGWAMTPAVWAPVIAHLPGRRWIAPALPGHAGAPAAAGAELAHWVEPLIRALPPATILVGWSLGALLALELAHRAPQHVTGLVLVGGSARFVADDSAVADGWPGLAAETVAAFRAGFADDPHATLKRFLALQCLGEPDRRATQALLGAALTPLAEARPADRPAAADQPTNDEPAAAERSATTTPPDDAPDPTHAAALADGLALLAAADLRAALPGITQPSLLIHGEHDALMPIAAARRLAQALPRARLETLAGSGHALPLTRSADCARLIAEFADA